MTANPPSVVLRRALELPDLDVFGVTVQVLLGSDESDGVFSLARIRCAPGCGAPVHRHAQSETFHVLRGELTAVCDGRVERLQAGDLVHIRPGASHSFANEGPEEVEFIATASPAGHEAFFREADALARSGGFNPHSAAQLCQRHGIELV